MLFYCQGRRTQVGQEGCRSCEGEGEAEREFAYNKKVRHAVRSFEKEMAVVDEVPPEQVVIEDVSDEEDDDLPELEDVQPEDSEPKKEKKKLNRAEKKARKALTKLGIKPVSGINRVTVKKSKNVGLIV